MALGTNLILLINDRKIFKKNLENNDTLNETNFIIVWSLKKKLFHNK